MFYFVLVAKRDRIPWLHESLETLLKLLVNNTKWGARFSQKEVSVFQKMKKVSFYG
jgi:hypothetical protein